MSDTIFSKILWWFKRGNKPIRNCNDCGDMIYHGVRCLCDDCINAIFYPQRKRK